VPGGGDTTAFDAHIAPLRRTEWIVYAKRPFAGSEQVLVYQSRYTQRIAISNRRLVALDDSDVAFTWRDYAHGSAQRIIRCTRLGLAPCRMIETSTTIVAR
jgi:hypothetical protein